MRNSAALAALLLLSCGTDSAPPDITIDQAWARATAPGQTVSAVYLTIINRGGEDRLLSVSSAAGQASLHSTSNDDGVVRMRPVDAVDIPADSAVELKPGGTHVMLAGLGQPLSPGMTLPLQLTFGRSGDRRIAAAVRPASAQGVTM